MSNKNWIPALTGLGFMVLIVTSFIVSGEPATIADDSVREIVDYYTDNDTKLWITTFMEVLAAVLLVFYGGYLRKVFRAAEGEGHMLSSVVMAGTTIVAIGAALDATINVALIESIEDIEPAAVQALSALWNNDFLVFALGTIVFMLAAGLTILRHGALPKWLGWFAILTAIVGMTPVGWFGAIGAGVWIIITSVMLALRERSQSTPSEPAAAA